MNKSILVHKNSYSKIHSTITRGILYTFDNVRLANLHHNIYDTCLSSRPSTIILQLDEYTQEIHQFINDTSLYEKNIVLTVDNSPCLYDKYKNLILDLHKNQVLNCSLILPVEIYSSLVEAGVNQNKLIAYNRLYNDVIFQPRNSIRNNKILCILDRDPSCIDIVKPYLYPNTTNNIVLVNNPEVEYDQNIGLLFDEDMDQALNSYQSVIDLSKSYEAEIIACGIPSYSLSEDWISNEPQVIQKETTPVTVFINNIAERIS